MARSWSSVSGSTTDSSSLKDVSPGWRRSVIAGLPAAEHAVDTDTAGVGLQGLRGPPPEPQVEVPRAERLGWRTIGHATVPLAPSQLERSARRVRVGPSLRRRAALMRLDAQSR